MLLHSALETCAPKAVSSRNEASAVQRGQELFLMNCAHCHGDDARGTEEAPDLSMFSKSDLRIASVVKELDHLRTRSAAARRGLALH